MTIDELIERLEEARDNSPDDGEEALDGENVIYIVEGQQLGYGSKNAWEVC